MIILNWLARVNQWHDRDANINNRLMNMLFILFGPWFILIALSLLFNFEFSRTLPIIWMCCMGIIRILWFQGFLNKYL